MHKRPGFLRMALETDCIAGSSRPQLPGLEPAMGIMAIAALHHAFIDPMMKGTIELLFGFQMATVAKLRLLFLHQALAFPGVVRRMTVDATHVVFKMRRARKITVFFSVAVAIQATRAGGLCGNAFEGKYLGLVAAAFHMFFARAVTSFAALPLRSALVIERGHEVRRGLKILEDVLVAGFAGFGANVKGWVGGPVIVLGLSLLSVGVSAMPGFIRGGEATSQTENQSTYRNRKHRHLLGHRWPRHARFLSGQKELAKSEPKAFIPPDIANSTVLDDNEPYPRKCSTVHAYRRNWKTLQLSVRLCLRKPLP